MEEEKKELCGYCKKPIHIDDFGGIDKNIGFFHSKCYLKAEKDKGCACYGNNAIHKCYCK